MTNSRVIVFLLFAMTSSLMSQAFLDRLNVPIYTTYSLSTGYDSNMFRLSDFDKEFQFQILFLLLIQIHLMLAIWFPK